MNLNFYTLCVIYLVYSFLGWVGETVVATAKGRRFTNRGVASGPFCFVYGTAGVLITIGLNDQRTSLAALFFGSMIYATVVEWLTAKLLEMGARVEERDDAIRVRSIGDHRAVTFKTQVYPGFPTDLQAPMMAVACKTPGTSVFLETIFENRFMHAAELSRLGAHIWVENRVAVVEGTPYLTGAPVRATDLRAGAALVIAGLMAQGTTEIYNTYFIDRGYEHLEEKLNSLGAKISRTRE